MDSEKGLAVKDTENKLLNDVKKWSDWVLEESRKEIGKFYSEADDTTIVGYITARTIPCPNNACGVEIPLMNYYWLSRRKGRMIAVYPSVNNKKISFEIVGDGYAKMPKGFDPNRGTISQARVVCIACGTVVDPSSLKRIFWEKKSWDKQIAVILSKKGMVGKTYRVANESDQAIFVKAKNNLKAKRKKMLKESVLDPVPDEMISTPDNREYQPDGLYYVYTHGAVLYKITKWRDLFNARQMLSLVVFTEKIKMAHMKMIGEGHDLEYSKAIVTYLAIMLDKLADKNSNFVRYNVAGEKIEQTFGRPGLTMVWYYAELNPFAANGWNNIQNWVLRVIKHCSDIKQPSATVLQESAMHLVSYPNEYFDAIFTDPPYYDNILYSIISDFFYVWLKRSIGHFYPELFSTPLTPKSNEAVSTASLVRGTDKKKHQAEGRIGQD